MNVYLDASVILRRLLRRPDALPGWSRIRSGVTSRIAETEGVRTLDRMRVTGSVSEKAVARAKEALYRMMESLDVVEVTRTVLARAAQPATVTVGTLDAIHLASALLWSERTQKSVTLATHDAGLALAARAAGLRVLGS